MLKTEKIGVARVVIQTKQHLAALVPFGQGLVLNLLRWNDEIRPFDPLGLPLHDIEKSALSRNELKMAEQLVQDMTTQWTPENYRDEFKDAIMKLVARRVRSGKTQTVLSPESVEKKITDGAQIVNLIELLERSLRKPHSKAVAVKKISAKVPALSRR